MANSELLRLIKESLDINKFQDEHWEGSFHDYLALVEQNPMAIRTAHQRLYDMILSYGVEEIERDKVKLTRYRFFEDPFEDGTDGLYGLEVPLMNLVSVFKSAAHGFGPERRVRFRAIGRPEGVPPRVAEGIRRLTDTTAGNTGLTLLMAFNYGGRDELVDAVRSLARDVARGALRPEDIDEVRVARALYTDGIPDPDLLIRTSGELRVSNFLLWQIAYTELWVTSTLWPDFGAREFCLAVADFQQRNRRFGSV